MKNLKIFLPIAAAFVVGCSNSDTSVRTSENFNYDWKFSLQADSNAVTGDYDDSNWRVLNLPHDWSIEQDFSETALCGPGGGALPGGYGVYRKHFTIPAQDSVKQIFVCFDGVYWQSTVYVNGKKVGFRPNGYVSFQYDISEYLKFGEDNLISVTVDNSDQPNSRWYSGSGIYRNVYLKKVNKEHVIESETFVTTSDITDNSANVTISTQISGEGEYDIDIKVFNPDGTVAAKLNDNISANNLKTFNNLTVNNPLLWTPDSPKIYSAEIALSKNGKLLDNYKTTFGIRYFSFDNTDGFKLNGKVVRINGVCNHHDLGALGTAVNHTALKRQLRILKEMGCNSIRTSHNPPAVELLNLCDSMGFIVMDEAFDMWAKKKTVNDYGRYFAQWHEKDLTDFIKRDRNHPSVIIWSVGNEILEQWSDINTDTLDIAKANLMFNFAAQLSKGDSNSDSLHVNSLLCKKLVDLVKSVDPTRPVTTGNNETEPFNLLFKANALDIIGFNYHDYNWGEAFKQKYPSKPLIITEAVSALQTRGNYIMPADTQYLWPARWDLPFETPDHKCSAYDNTRAPWGSTHETTLKAFQKYPWVSGIYVWTGFDYLGEPTPYGWPSRSSFFGIIDLAGFPKDVYYLYQSLWRKDIDVLHLLPHWNWKQGETIEVWAYTNLKEVELFLNGKSLGKKSFENDKLHISWDVPFEKGELKAVGKNSKGEEVTAVVKTAETASKLVASVDGSEILADGADLSFVTFDITDDNGTLVPDACNMINFEISGAGEIAGLDNGDQNSHEKFQGNKHSAFNGKVLCIVKSKRGEKGTITLTAKADGLKDAVVTIKTK
ncbi:MAG: DUF4982 domain-containing protein [Bacteroidales bacterium]|nr:DUF4982 domain-containing protein [Bacteroidales bacterium]